jgi:hypothetical protein
MRGVGPSWAHGPIRGLLTLAEGPREAGGRAACGGEVAGRAMAPPPRRAQERLDAPTATTHEAPAAKWRDTFDLETTFA